VAGIDLGIARQRLAHVLEDAVVGARPAARPLAGVRSARVGRPAVVRSEAALETVVVMPALRAAASDPGLLLFQRSVVAAPRRPEARPVVRLVVAVRTGVERLRPVRVAGRIRAPLLVAAVAAAEAVRLLRHADVVAADLAPLLG